MLGPQPRMEAGPSLLRLLLPVLWGSPTPTRSRYHSGTGVSVLPTLLGLTPLSSAPQRVIKPSREMRSSVVLQAAVGRAAGRRRCPAGERLGRCVYEHHTMAPLQCWPVSEAVLVRVRKVK